MGAGWTLMDQWNYSEYQACLLGKQSMGGIMTIAVAKRLVKDMIQVQMGMFLVHPLHIMSVKQSSSKIYDRRPVLTKK
jgi:hypothetical protein